MAPDAASGLLERADELAALDAALERAVAGEGGPILLLGPAGSGKTRLLDALRALATDRGVGVRAARGGELEQDLAWGVARDLLAGVAVPGDGPGRAAAVVLTPGAGAASAEGVLHGLAWVLADLAESEGPLLVCVDDAHWVDAPSLMLLAHVARRLEGLPLTLVLAARPRDPDADRVLLDGLASEPGAVIVEPGRSSPAAVASVLGTRLTAAPGAELVTACYAATGGSPLLITELAAELGRRATPGAADVAALAPAGVVRSVDLRLARLGAEAAALARAVAILGDGCGLGEAAALVDLAEARAGPLATALGDSQLLADAAPLRFAHPLLRTAVLDGIGAAERRLLHGRAARVLRRRGIAAERVALQVLAAEPAADPEAVAVLREAASAARRQGAPAAAARLLERALAEPPPGGERAGVLAALASAELSAGRAGAAERVEAALAALEDPAIAAALALEATEQLTARLGAESLRPLAVRGLEAAERAHDPELVLRLRAIGALQSRHGPDGDPSAGRELEAELRRDGATTPSGRYALAVAMMAQPVDTPGRAVEAARTIRTAWPDGLLPIGAAAAGVIPLLHADELDDAFTWLSELEAEQRWRTSPAGVARVTTVRSVALQLLGDLRGAEADAREAEELVDRASFALTVRTVLLVLLDRGEGAAARVELARRGLEGDLPPGPLHGPVLHARALVRLGEGDLDGARADLEALAVRSSATGLDHLPYPPWRSDLALVLAAQGDIHGAGRRAREELARADATWPTHSARGIALRALGTVTPGAEGIALLEEAVAVLERSPRRLELARGLLALGSALRRGRRRAAARAPLERAMDLAHRSGAAAVAGRARDELLATGARPRRLATAGVDGLTPSELRVARLAARGRTNREIAQELFVTRATVETHLRHVFQKLDLAGRGEIAGVLEAAGTQPGPDLRVGP